MFYVQCFLFLFIILFLFYLLDHYIQSIKNTITYEPFYSSNIPKIIHQTAPKDTSKWKEVWFECQKSWKEKYPDYQYILWTDEDLDAFMKKNYNSYYSMYINYDKNIKRIDMARYFILYHYGGIYADMDYECINRFEHLLPSDKVSICESPYKEWEEVQNSLMVSPIHHPFWFKVIEKASYRTHLKNILKSTGPILLTDIYVKNKDMVYILNVDMYNPKPDSEQFKNPNIYTRHFGTISWEE